MAEALCPRGHISSEPDFCSECGLRIATGAADGAVAPAGAAPAEVVPCPDCGTPRTPGARFCEVCRHDFGAAAPAIPAGAAPPSPPSAAASPAPEQSAPVVPAPHPAVPSRRGGGANVWAVVRCDRAMMGDREAGTGFPEHEPDRSYPLDLSENLLGRRNARRDLHPEIPINDPSVSARHLKICRRPDGSLYVVDVGSSNGTMLNGTALDEGVEAELTPGDSLTLGLWTRVGIEAR